MDIRIKLTDPRAIIPVQREGDVGADLHALTAVVVYPGRTVRIPTGVAVEIPDGYTGLMLPRSGCSLKGLGVWSPPIDPGYRGEIHAIAYNTSTRPWLVNAGDRVCQLVILPAPRITFEPCADLSTTARGSNGFGSSGVGPRAAGNSGRCGAVNVDANGSPVTEGD